MQDLNDLFYFAKVVEHGGFAAAGRALGIPKSKLSRRLAQLEERLGIRLIQRSTRRFAVTEAGELYHRHCLALVAEAEAAQQTIERAQAEPQGVLRVSCPVPLLQLRLAPILSRFLARYPRVELRVEATNRRVDLIEERIDVALRVRPPPLEDSDLVIRVLESHRQLLVAAPALAAEFPPPARLEDLAGWPCLDMARFDGVHAWRVQDPDGAWHSVLLRPRLVVDDMVTLRQAALDGLGVVQLPGSLIGPDLAAGRLTPLLSEWRLPGALVHAVFSSRRGLAPAVRHFLDFLTEAVKTPW